MFTMKRLLQFSCFLGFLCYCNGYPIDPGAMVASSTVGLAALGVVFLVMSVIFLIGCACCRGNNGFKQFRNSTGSLSHIGFTNRLASELSIFPPPGVLQAEPSPPPGGGGGGRNAPPLNNLSTKPAAFSLVAPDVSDWFVDPVGNFPRQQLFYQRELGRGWFGKVVEGEAKGCKVVVRILREDATQQEKAHFLNEAKPYRDLRHRNVASLFGKCVDHDPYLLLFDLCNNGDLKSFLVTNSTSKAVLNEQGICLRMMTDVAEGLNYMIENSFIHTDLAARNCLVASDLTVKVGDYGTGIDLYKDEYYITENVAIPIRWCAPETLHCTPTTIEAKQVTSAANVWSLGVLLWEIAEFGKLPYENLTDDQVIIRVFGSEKLRLPQPDSTYGLFLYNILQLCWRLNDRANLSQVLSMLHYLRSNPVQDSDFDIRWTSMKPNTIPRVDNHTPMHSPRHTDLAQRPQLQAKSEFDSGVDLEMKATDSCRSTTPLTLSPQLSVTSDDFLQSKKSASLTNLQGSLEDVHQLDSWLQGVEQKTDEDRNFVKNVSQAIKNLDETLALEQADSSQDEGSLQPLVPSFRLGPIGAERKSESSSDTEEETWRTRIERGEFTEKVKEKSKSVTDLMVLTHIDSEGSETDSLPSLTRQYSIKKTNKPAFTSIGFGSEGNIRNAVLSEDLQDKLKQLSLWKTDDQSFLGKAASETNKCVNKVSTSQNKNKSNIVKPKSLKCGEDEVRDVDSVNKIKSEISNVKSDCQTEVREKNVLSSLINPPLSLPVDLHLRNNELEGELNLSSHDIKENPIPEIRITESHIPDSYVEPEADVDTQFLVNIVPRKFVIVCKESDMYDDDDTSETISQLEPADQQDYDVVSLKSEQLCDQSNDNGPSSVILGSCEDYTLEYFKGLKTTFVPPDSSSEDGSEKIEQEMAEDSDFVNDDSQLSQINEDGTRFCDNQNQEDDCSNITKSRHRDSIDDLFPDSLTNSVTTISNSSGYATIEKDKALKQDYNISHEDPTFTFSSDNTLLKQNNLSEGINITLQNTTEQFSEKGLPNDLLDPEILSDNLKDQVPKFIVDDIISQNAFTLENCKYNYFSDSGEGSSSQQEYEIKELKSRLEDAMKFNNDYHLKRSDEEYNGKIVTPDDERSSDSGFRDKGSLSESAEDTCDEKYNIEDIDAELDEFSSKSFENYDSLNQEEFRKRRSEGIESWFLHQQLPQIEKDGWLPESTEFDVREAVCVNADFINAIRHELQDKLPQSCQSLNDDDEDSSPESENADNVVQFNFPAQLSPIAEERESNQSSLVLDEESPAHLLDIPELKHDSCQDEADRTFIIDTPCKDSLILEDLEDGAQFTLHSGTFSVEDDVLVVDTETNEATLIESPKPQSHLAFMPFKQLNENFREEVLPCQVLPDSHTISRESVNYSPDISLDSQSLSSPENGNLSGFFMSPCSVRSDLFDSGPPSLPFDIGQSIEEIEEISPRHEPGNENISSANEKPAEDMLNPTSSASPILSEKDHLLVDANSSMKLNVDSVSDSGSATLTVSPNLSSDNLKDYLQSNASLLSHKSTICNHSNEPITECSNSHLRQDLENNGFEKTIQSNLKVSSDSLEKVNDVAVNFLNNEQDTPDSTIGNNGTLEMVKDKPSETVEFILDRSSETGEDNSCLPDLVKSVLNNTSSQDSEKLCLKEEPLDNCMLGTSTPQVDHKKAEGDIDLLITSQKSPPVIIEDESIKKDHKNVWLEELLSMDDNFKVSNNETSTALDKNGWPSVEELVVMQPCELSSTIALKSPDRNAEYPALPLTPCSPVLEAFGDSAQTSTGSNLASPDESWKPTIGQLMDMVEQVDPEEMTTSFIEPDENGTYTPDWESDTSESSSSGEFIWKEGERENSIRPLLATPDDSLSQEPKMERIEEECEDESSSSDEGSCTSEFVPSTWDSSLTPIKSTLRSPSKVPSIEKKKVIFKKEKYQCIYEYPREPSDDEEESTSWQTPTSVFDYYDWELGENEFTTLVDGDSDSDESKTNKKPQDFDFYRLNYNSNSSFPLDEGEFFSTSADPTVDLEVDSGDEFCPTASDLTPLKEPSSLGVLRHTKDQLKLDLKPVQPDRGEANILDSGIDTCSA